MDFSGMMAEIGKSSFPGPDGENHVQTGSASSLPTNPPSKPDLGETSIEQTAMAGVAPCATSEVPILSPASVVEVTRNQSQPTPAGRTTVLFVTPSGKISQHLLFAFIAERFVPRIVGSIDSALTEIQTQKIDAVFIEEGLRSKSGPLLSRLRTQHSATSVRYYATEAGLLLNNSTEDSGFDLFQKNLQLLRHLTSGEQSISARHAVAVSRLADAICARLNLPTNLRQIVVTAASLHNIAERQLTTTEGFNRTDIIGLSAGRLAEWGYPPPVEQMLRSMYRDCLPGASDYREFDKLGSSILTAADCFCHTWPDTSKIGSHQVNELESKLRALVGTSVIPDIISATISVVSDDLTAQMLRYSPFRVHVLRSRGSLSDSLQQALENAHFAVSESHSIDECAQFCRQYGTRALVIRDTGSVQDVYDVIISLAMRGVALDQISTLLLLENGVVAEATRLLRHGVEDILPASCDPMAVVAKLERMQERVDECTKQRLSVLKELGTHGSLEDMSLVDLLEVWRTNKRPVRIEVSAQSDQLTIFVDRGRIVHAESLNDTGSNAILKGMTWTRGIWNIDTIEPSQLPPPTVDQDITSVLLEACVRLDQASQLA